MSPSQPQIRANWSKHTLRHARRLPSPRREAVLAGIGDASLAQIGSAGILTWLPAEHHARIFDAVRDVLGQADAIPFWRDVMSSNLDSPLLRPLVQGGLRLFGATPYSVIRMSPQAWSLVTRNCGTHRVLRGEGPVELRMEFVEVPRPLATPGFVAHTIGNCEAVLRLLRLRGRTAMVEDRLARGSFTLEMRDVRADARATPQPSPS